MVYRNALRASKTRPSLDSLEATLLVPRDFIDWLLSEDFETDFETALRECND